MKKIVFAALLITFCGFNLFGQAAQTGFSEEEYKFISEIWVGSKNSLLVIKNETIPANISEREIKEEIHIDGQIAAPYLKKEIPNLSDEIIKDFNSKNDKAYQLQRKFVLNRKYKLVSDTDLSKIFYEAIGDLEKGWENFKKKYPNSFGYIQFSRIGFNKDKTQALIYMTYYCGSLCADGSYILYIKEKDKWTEKAKATLWVS